MNLYQLRYFYDSVRLNSTTEAAAVNFITQSAVSQAIRSLETALGHVLVHHRKNAFELTDTGKVVFGECQAVFGAVENLKANLSLHANSVTGRLSMAATNSIALTTLSGSLSQVAKAHPKLCIDLNLGNSDQIKERLRLRKSELGFILEDDEMEGFDSTLIKEGKFVFVSAPQFKPQKDQQKIIITRQNKIEIKHLKKKLGEKVKFDMEVFSWELIRQLCKNGAGIGYVPDFVVQQDLKGKTLKLVLTEVKTWRYKLLAIRLKGRVDSKNAQTFLNSLKSGIQ